jgi:hypothetical protein
VSTFVLHFNASMPPICWRLVLTRSLILLTTVIGQSVGRTADGDGMDATLTSTRSATVSSKCNELTSACRLNMYASMAGNMPPACSRPMCAGEAMCCAGGGVRAHTHTLPRRHSLCPSCTHDNKLVATLTAIFAVRRYFVLHLMH